MNDVGGCDSGTGLRAGKSSRSSADANFEPYDDSEWDVGIGNLIIDLDADIEKNTELTEQQSVGSNQLITSPASSTSSSSSPTPNQMHIPSNAAPSNSSSTGNSSSTAGGSSSSSGGKVASSKSASSSSSSGVSSKHGGATDMEHSAVVVDKGLKMKIKRKAGTKSGGEAKHEIVKNESLLAASNLNNSKNSSSDSSSSGKSAHHHPSSSSSKNNSTSNSENDSHGVVNNNGVSNKDSSTTNNDLGGGGGGGGSKKTSNRKGSKDSKEGGGGGRGESNSKKVKNTGGSGGSGGSTKNSKIDANNSNNNSSNNSEINSNKSHHGKESLSSATATVSLNVPTIVPGGSSSAFGKVNSSSTLKVPLSSSASSGSSNSSMQQQHSSPSDSSSRTSSSSGNNGGNTSSHLPASWNSSATSSPSKGGDGPKNLLDKVQNNTNNSNSSSGSLSYSNKKGRNSFSNSSEKIGGVETDGLNSSGGGHFNSSASRSGSVPTASPSVTDLSAGAASSVNHHQGMSLSHHHQQHQSLNAKGRPSTQDVCIGTSVGTVTEPDCLGPCEPGTSVTLEGIVWHETESGVLVVNVTWRGKTYVGTLLDCTKSEWAPPRFCDSPTSDLEMRLPKNRGKRGGRGQQSTPVNELTSASDAAAALLLQQGLGSGGILGVGGAGNGGNGRPGQNPKLRNGAKGRRGSAATTGTSAAAAAASFITPASPMKGQNNNSDLSVPKRKTRGSETETTDDTPVSSKNAKRPKLSTKDKTPGSPSSTLDGDSKSGPSSPALIECPEPNCSKKYKHINGLRYHQSHAHCVVAEDSDSNASTTSNAKEVVTNSSETPVVGGSAQSTNINSAVVVDGELESMESTISETNTAIGLNSGGGDSAMEVDKSEEPSPLKTPSSGKATGVSLSKSKEGESESKESPSVSRAPILTVPVPYISLQGRNAMSGGDVMKSAGSSSSSSVKGGAGGVPWQPHHHGGQGQQPGGGGGVGGSSMVSLNIPMSSESKSKDKSSSDGKSGKTKHKKSKKDKEKMKQMQESGGSPLKNEQCGSGGSGGVGVRGSSTPGGLFGSSSVQRDSVSSEDNEVRMVVGSGSGGEGSGGRIGVLEDPQSPAYSDISDANDSGDAVELTTGVKDHKPPPDLMQQKKDLHVPLHGHVPQAPVPQHQPPPQLSHPQQQPGIHGAPPPGMSPFYPAFYNPYANLEPPNSKIGDKGDEGLLEKGVSKIPPGQQPGGNNKGPPPQQQQPPGQPGQPPSAGDVDGSTRRSPKLDFHHPKYLPQQHFFHYPYSNYHFDGGQYGGLMSGGGGGNGGPPDGPPNAFNSHGRGGPPGGPPFGLMEQEKEKELPEKEKEGGIPLGLSIKQEPGEKMLHKDTGRHSSSHMKSSEMMEKDRMNLMSDIKSEYGMSPSDFSSGGKPGGHFSPIGCSKHSGNSSSGKESSSKREESSKGSSDSIKKESEEKDRKESEGKGPTMETTGPPPPPTAGSFAYLPQPYNPFGIHFDPGHPLYRQVIVPGPFGGPPYMHPHAGGMPRFQPPPPPPGPPGNGGGPPGGMPEDLSRAASGGVNPGGPSPGGPTAKALDMLQHHAQYYQVHKIHELSERALKSPSPQVVQQRERPDRSDAPTAPPQPPLQPQSSASSAIPTAASPGGSSSSRNMSKLGAADLSNKDPNSSKMSVGSVNESSRSPPTQHHVHSHTHHHTHVGIGYPIIPAFPAPHSPHYGVIPTAPPTAASVIPPFPTPKPN